MASSPPPHRAPPTPHEEAAAASLQASTRALLLRRKQEAAAVCLQRWMRRRGRAPPRSHPFVELMQRKLYGLAALALVTLFALDVSVHISSPETLGRALWLEAMPLMIGGALSWRRLRHCTAEDAFSPAMLGLTAHAVVKALVIALHLAQEHKLAIYEVRSVQQFPTLRSIHMGVLCATAPCSPRVRRACAALMLAAICANSALTSEVVGQRDVLRLLSNGLSYLLVFLATSRLAEVALRDTRAREQTMGDLRLALDASAAAGVPHQLVDEEEVARAWTEGPLVRILAVAGLVGSCVYAGFIYVLKVYLESKHPTTIAYVFAPGTMLIGVITFTFAMLTLFVMPERRSYQAARAFSYLLLAVHSAQVVIKSADVAAAWRAASDADCSQTCEWVAESPFYEIFGPPMSFLRCLITTLLPVSPRLRPIIVLLVITKQLISSIERVIGIEPAQIVAIMLRDLTIAMLGVAVVSAAQPGAHDLPHQACSRRRVAGPTPIPRPPHLVVPHRRARRFRLVVATRAFSRAS